MRIKTRKDNVPEVSEIGNGLYIKAEKERLFVKEVDGKLVLTNDDCCKQRCR